MFMFKTKKCKYYLESSNEITLISKVNKVNR